MTVSHESKLRGSPLSGVVVIDFTSFLSGPFCTQILADLGAEIIKVETFDGDLSRSVPPHFVDGLSAYYLHVNRNKKSIAIDLKNPRGLGIALGLVGKADVVVENFRPGVAKRLGLDPRELTDRSPGLIWASISGFGQSGPRRDEPAYDMIVQALSGVMSLTGEPGGSPVRLGIPAGDLVAGMYAAIGILAALREPAQSRRSQVIDIAMLDCLLSMLSYQATYALLSGEEPRPQGAAHDSIPTYRSFVARDGRVLVVTANTERMWRDLCQVLELPDLPKDPRFADSALRLQNRAELWRLLEAAFRTRDAADWVARLVAAGVPAAPILSVNEALAEARTSGRGMVVDLESANGHRVPVLGNPIRFEQAPPSHGYPPPLSGDSEDILGGYLGMQSEEIEELRRTKVLLA